MGKVLVIYHSQGGTTEEMATAICEGARQVKGADITVKKGFDAGVDELLGCDAVAVGSPLYFGYTTEEMENFCTRASYRAHGKVADKPCVVFGSANGPASTVLEYVEKMCFSVMRFRTIAPSVRGSGSITERVIDECRALGRKLAEAARK
jgi:multimeric flavodoxin WrbA